MPRLFVAVWPPDDVLDLIARLPRPDLDGLRWTKRDQWHVTLRFLGRVDDVDAVVSALNSSPVKTMHATEAVVGPALGRFGGRILHVPVSGLAGIAEVVTAVTASIGEPPEDRPFHGHITLGRVAKGARVDLRPFTDTEVEARWTVGDICLVESQLSPKGARYQVLDRFCFS